MSKKKEQINFKFKGFMVIECPECKVTFPLSSKSEVSQCSCRKCGATFELPDKPIPLVAYCECGKRIKAVTNATSKVIEFKCLCDYPLVAEYNHHKNKYFGML